MAESKSLYPPSPPDVPEGLTDYADSFAKQQKRVLTGLFVFLIFYFAMIVLFAMVGSWCYLTLSGELPGLKVVGIVLSSIFFLFLVKGLFKQPAVNRDMYVEIHDDEHPKLFDFLEQLCHELGAPFPNRVYVCPDVIAEYSVSTSIFNVLTEPRHELLIGLGVVNCTNLSEFKAVLAHEFGQFCHLGRSKSYCAVVQNIVLDLIEGEDFFDRFLKSMKRNPDTDSGGFNLKMLTWPLVYPASWILETGHAVLWFILKTVALPGRGMAWEQEFHADLVAVCAAGSDALTHALLRVRFGMQCFNQAIDDLLPLAEDNDLFSNDMYLHQDRAGAIVRWKNQQPELGLPPALPEPNSGETIRVFDSQADEYEDQDTPPMWRGHPANADREENAKEHFVPAVMDHRSPWILFKDAAELKDRMSYEFYRVALHIGQNAELADAREVQGYIDQTYPEITHAPLVQEAPRISRESGELPKPKAVESVSLAPVEEPIPVVQLPLEPPPSPSVASTKPAVPNSPVLPAATAAAADELKPKTVFDAAIQVVEAEPIEPAGTPVTASSTEDELFVAEAVVAETVTEPLRLPVELPPVEPEPESEVSSPLIAAVGDEQPTEILARGALDGEPVAVAPVVEEPTPVLATREPEPVPAVVPALPLEIEENVTPPVEAENPISFEVEDHPVAVAPSVDEPLDLATEETTTERGSDPVVVCGSDPVVVCGSTFDAVPTLPPESKEDSEAFTLDAAGPAAATSEALALDSEGSRSGTSFPTSSSSEVSLAKSDSYGELPTVTSSPSTGSLRPIVKIGIATFNAPAPSSDTGVTPAPRPAFLPPPIAKPDATSTPMPLPRSAFGSGALPVVVGTVEETVVPANGRRPAVRITFVKPGEKSPIKK